MMSEQFVIVVRAALVKWEKVVKAAGTRVD